MRILLANSTCKVGGVSTFLLSLRRGLVAAGHDCELFFFDHGTMDRHLPPEWPIHFGGLPDILRLVSRGRFTVVHANNVDWPTGIAAVRELGARLTLTAHKVRVNGTYGWTSRNCDAFAGVARWIARDLQPYTDLPIATVPNGVDTQRFTPEPPGGPTSPQIVGGGHAPIVAWVGRAGSAHKRLDRLALMAPALRAAGARIWVLDPQGPEALATLYGSELANTLAAHAERWQPAPFESMPAIYREVAASGGCLLSTSASEGMPLALLEAQACGCPVVASDVRGNNECIGDRSGGLLFPVDLPDREIAERVLVTLSDTAQLNRLRADGPRYVGGQFSLEATVSRYVELYESTRPAVSNGRRARARLSPLTNWRDYREYRWGVGASQYSAASVFTRAGDADLAAAALRASWHTAPTLYLRPERLARLLDARIRRIRPGDAAADAGTSSASGRLHAHTGESMRTELRSWLTVTPRQKTPKACGSDEILDGRKPAQMGWYGFVAGRLDGEQVLDVGCGSGEGLKILTAHARSAMGIDLDDRLRRPDVHVEIKSIADMPDKSFDVVVCMDVIEHVVDDKAFVAELFRVARKAVFVTTPNYAMSRNRHPYHVREYTPAEFTHLFEGYGDMTLYAGSAHGFEQVEITRRWPYFLVNALYVWKPTQIAAKVLKRVLGVKVWKHNAALVRVGAAGRQAQSPAAAA